LVVDDDENIRMVLQKSLEKEGYQIYNVTNTNIGILNERMING